MDRDVAHGICIEALEMNPYPNSVRKRDGIVNRALRVLIQHSLDIYAFVIIELDRCLSFCFSGVCYRHVYRNQIAYQRIVWHGCQVSDLEIGQVPFVNIRLDYAISNICLVHRECGISNRRPILMRLYPQHIARVCERRTRYELVETFSGTIIGDEFFGSI